MLHIVIAREPHSTGKTALVNRSNQSLTSGTRRVGCRYSAARISSTTFFASPKSMLVFSRKNSGLPMPA